MSAASTGNVFVAVMGATGTGKTSFINLASESTLRVGTGLRSCTSTLQYSQPILLDGLSVTLIDTPGFDDTTASDSEILKTIAVFLASEYGSQRLLSGVIYMHRISDPRVGGASKRNMEMFRKLCGDDALKNAVLVTNMWGTVSQALGEAREAELLSDDTFFKPMIEGGAQLRRHNNTQQSSHDILRSIIHKPRLPLLIQRELVDHRLDIHQTSAGRHMLQVLMMQSEQYRAQIQNLQEELDEAIQERDEEMRMALEADRHKLQQALERIQGDYENLEAGLHDGAPTHHPIESLATAQVASHTRQQPASAQVNTTQENTTIPLSRQSSRHPLPASNSSSHTAEGVAPHSPAKDAVTSEQPKQSPVLSSRPMMGVSQSQLETHTGREVSVSKHLLHLFRKLLCCRTG